MINTTQSDVAGTAPVTVDKTIPMPRTRRMARQPKSNAKQPEDKTGEGKVERTVSPPAQPTSPRPPSKIASVVALLERKQGATLAEMVGATGWLPHTTRAALTGLKKKGHTLIKDKRDDVTCYRIVKAG